MRQMGSLPHYHPPAYHQYLLAQQKRPAASGDETACFSVSSGGVSADLSAFRKYCLRGDLDDTKQVTPRTTIPDHATGSCRRP
jgi:hypothetical protein